MFFYLLASELLLNKSIPDKFVSDNIQMLTELHIFLLNLLLIRQSILPFLKVSLKHLSFEADILSSAIQHRGPAHPDVDLILFDEFIPEDRRYMKGALKGLMSLTKTVFSGREGCRCICT